MGNDKITKTQELIPKDGIEYIVSAEKGLTRIHLDMGKDGISLSTVGAASAALPDGKRQIIRLKPTKDGISLALVGAASASK